MGKNNKNNLKTKKCINCNNQTSNKFGICTECNKKNGKFPGHRSNRRQFNKNKATKKY